MVVRGSGVVGGDLEVAETDAGGGFAASSRCWSGSNLVRGVLSASRSDRWYVVLGEEGGATVASRIQALSLG